jgi:hypothetical protein
MKTEKEFIRRYTYNYNGITLTDFCMEVNEEHIGKEVREFNKDETKVFVYNEEIDYNIEDDYIIKKGDYICQVDIISNEYFIFKQEDFLKTHTLTSLLESSNDTKALDNTNIDDVKKTTYDVVVYGNGDLFQLISKASSKSQGWMKSTKAMEIEGVGCIVQVTTEITNPDKSKSVAEALTFVSGVKIEKYTNDKNEEMKRLISNLTNTNGFPI